MGKKDKKDDLRKGETVFLVLVDVDYSELEIEQNIFERVVVDEYLQAGYYRVFRVADDGTYSDPLYTNRESLYKDLTDAINYHDSLLIDNIFKLEEKSKNLLKELNECLIERD